MKMNQDILSIPPYISTSWKNISSLHLDGYELVITLLNGAMIRVPNLPGETLEKVFEAHAIYLEEKAASKALKPKRQPEMNIELSMMPNEGALLEGFNLFEHDPRNRHARDLPQELLQKISALTQTLGFGSLSSENIPRPEPHCNCFYCQIARAIQNSDTPQNGSSEEAVSQSDLTFREWVIQPQTDLLYSVSNPANPSEHYEVDLDSPIHCSCGHKHCEHIQAVLRS